MKIIRSIDEMREWTDAAHSGGKRIGLVPTMGALHEGHLSLLERSKRLADFTVISIFVNPAQFGPSEDLARYPRPFDEDCARAAAAGCDVVFAPAPEQMYPAHFTTYVTVSGLGNKLCGVSRPTHFRGVTTVVLKLFNIVRPRVAVFGAKDAQQAIVLRRMAADLNVPVALEICETVREADGLAMSSRNAYLTLEERNAAPVVFRSLQAAASLYGSGERGASALLEAAKLCLLAEPLVKLEYLELVDLQTLEPCEEIDAPALCAVACRTALSNTRLIDNITIGGLL